MSHPWHEIVKDIAEQRTAGREPRGVVISRRLMDAMEERMSTSIAAQFPGGVIDDPTSFAGLPLSVDDELTGWGWYLTA